MVYNMCSLSLDAKQLAFSARPMFQEVLVQGLTGRTGWWGYSSEALVAVFGLRI